MTRHSFRSAGFARCWQDLFWWLCGRRLSAPSRGADPPTQLPLVARRSTQWQSIDALLDTLRQAEAGSDIAA